MRASEGGLAARSGENGVKSRIKGAFWGGKWPILRLSVYCFGNSSILYLAYYK
jgi:hypothetical protein